MFSELIRSPEVTLIDPGPIHKIISSFNRVEILFDADQKTETGITVMKTHPLGIEDLIYNAIKKHFKLETDFFIVENIPYADLPESSVVCGTKIGVLFLSSSARFGGYATILKQVEMPLSNKGNRLVGKGALFISFPNPLMTVNRRKRFRLYPQVEDYFCEISGCDVKRDSPVQTFPIRTITDLGISILMPTYLQSGLPKINDTVFIRISLFLANKGYQLKRGVVVCVSEVMEGKVTQQIFALKCQVLHAHEPNDRTTEIAMKYVGWAKENITVDSKLLPKLKYDPIDPNVGIEPILAWVNKIQQIRRSEEKARGLA